MMPWWHLAASLIVSYILVASLGLDIVTGITWIAVGCFFGTFIDLDHVVYAILIFKKKARPIIYKGIVDPKGLIDDFGKKRILSILAWKRLIFHLFTMLTIYTISLYLFPSYSLVIGVVFISHLILDIDPRWLKY